jgi:hypothetical protein
VFIALVTQPAMRVHHIFICSLSGSKIFFQVFSGKKLLRIKVFVLIFNLEISSGKFFVLKRIERDIIVNLHWSSRKVIVILMELEFSGQIFDKYSK